MTASCSTSHSLIVWTQEVNWPYRGQTHKVVLAVWCRAMCMCVDGGGGRRHFLLFFCCWRVPMSAPARSYSVAWAGRASASLAYRTPHSHTADLRSYYNCCSSGHRARSWTVCLALKTSTRREESEEKEIGRREDWRTKVLKSEEEDIKLWMKWQTYKNLHAGMCIVDWSCYVRTPNG